MDQTLTRMCFTTPSSDFIYEASDLKDAPGQAECAVLASAEEQKAGKPNLSRLEQKTTLLTLLQNTNQGMSGPYLQFTPAKGTEKSVNLQLDVLCLRPKTATVQNVAESLREAVRTQLREMGKILSKSDATKGFSIAASHFWPCALPHPVTLCFPTVGSEDSQLLLRQQWHSALYLPDWPFLRPSVSLKFSSPTSDRLRNVHLHALPSGVAGGKQSLLQGNYDYYHYMQDKFNDDGWGCAYRTFMTICSWYLLQGYTPVAVPSHRAIQLALVELGEKPKEIIGSKQWLGSIELGLVLDHILGFQARILPINSGAEIPNHARQLAEHFRKEGTPVMIGGGQFAYGLLGVDFNENTGDVQFLILDPHYKGAEDVREITSKKWCSWYKAADIFENSCFYNFCLPIRPKMI